MGGGPGGPGITPGDPKAAADDARANAPKDTTGINSKSKDDHRVEVNNQVCHTEDLWWREIKGGKGENKFGGFLEFIGGLKHSMTFGFKTTLDASFNKTYDLGPYFTEMAAMKYEVLASKKEKVFGKKTDNYLGWKLKKIKGGWLEARAEKLQKAEALEKEIHEKLTERLGPLLEATAAKHQAKAKEVQERISTIDLKVASKLRVKFENARMVINELDQHVSNIKIKCGKFERHCSSMDEAVGALLEIKGAKTADKAASLKVKASLLKFTGSIVKLGE